MSGDEANGSSVPAEGPQSGLESTAQGAGQQYLATPGEATAHVPYDFTPFIKGLPEKMRPFTEKLCAAFGEAIQHEFSRYDLQQQEKLSYVAVAAGQYALQELKGALPDALKEVLPKYLTDFKEGFLPEIVSEVSGVIDKAAQKAVGKVLDGPKLYEAAQKAVSEASEGQTESPQGQTPGKPENIGELVENAVKAFLGPMNIHALLNKADKLVEGAETAARNAQTSASSALGLVQKLEREIAELKKANQGPSDGSS